jgi:ornithine cyclodeaminase
MVMRMPDGSGFLGLMPGQLAPDKGNDAALGMKAVSVFPGNVARGIDSHQGAVLLFEPDTGRLAALMDGATITAIRTAAVSAVATDLLARTDAAELAILGAGVQARTHLEAIAAVRRLRRVRVWSRNPEHARHFAEQAARGDRLIVDAVSSAEEAVRDADIVTTVTASPEPVLSRAWLKEGVHINAVGSSTPTAREIDTATMAEVQLFVDRRESALNEAGDVLIPMREGAFKADHIQAELGDVIIEKHPGRRKPDELTLFKSLGIAVEDVAAAAYVVRRARETGTGQTVAM